MDKTYRTEFRRKYLIEALPEPLTRASRHLQIFINYIAATRLRIRSIRDPETKTWSWSLEQRVAIDVAGLSATKVSEIYLSEAEHAVFEIFEGTEIRKNRYFHEIDRMPFAFDVYLGELWGLNIANVDFADEKSMSMFEPPPFAIFEITNEPFFLGENLVEKKFDDVRAEVLKIGDTALVQPRTADD